MEKRILIAFILSFAVLYGFRFMYPTPTPPPEAPVAEKTDPPVPPPVAPPTSPAVPETGADAEIRAEAEELEPVETDLYTAIISNTGGILRSFRLNEKGYPDANGKPLELINSPVASKVGWPLAIVSGDAALDKLIAEANFVVKREGRYKVSLEFASQGLHALKTIEFDNEKYLVQITTQLSRSGQPVPHQVVWQGGFGDQSITPDPVQQQAIYGDGSEFDRVGVTSIDEPQDVTAPLAGVEDQYFLAMFVGPQPIPAKISKSDYNLPDGTAARALYVAVPSTTKLQVYVGPKQSGALSSADARLAAVPNYGWFGIITKPLIVILLGIHGFVGNFGWAIVILTIIINLVMFPLRVKQQLSMQRMQKMAPQMRSLQEKYKKLKAGDPKRAEVEAELMKMNKEQMSGCLPSLLQMPLLFAFWSMLSVSIELRHAPWIFWIQDLSQADPWKVLPILMALSMLIQQKMTPTTMDPMQAKMMMVMPVLFLAMFWWAQSGVALYWLTSTVVGIGQQWFIKEYWTDDNSLKPSGRNRKPPAE